MVKLTPVTKEKHDHTLFLDLDITISQGGCVLWWQGCPQYFLTRWCCWEGGGIAPLWTQEIVSFLNTCHKVCEHPSYIPWREPLMILIINGPWNSLLNTPYLARIAPTQPEQHTASIAYYWLSVCSYLCAELGLQISWLVHICAQTLQSCTHTPSPSLMVRLRHSSPSWLTSL